MPMLAHLRVQRLSPHSPDETVNLSALETVFG
jgi:hypothetical protein